MEKNAEQLEYDLAISFAGENRSLASEIANILLTSGYKIFYDDFERVTLLGQDLEGYFEKIFFSTSKFCLMIVSADYLVKSWTIIERRYAIERALKDISKAYILPLRIDDTMIDGIPKSIGYLDIRKTSVKEVCNLLIVKMGSPFVFINKQDDSESTFFINEVLRNCYRRAVFTRYHAQLDHNSMFLSLSECRSHLQSIVMCIKNESNRQMVVSIIAEFDLIERNHHSDFTWSGLGTMGTIDGAKLRIINTLNALAKDVGTSFPLPLSLTEEIFFNKTEADLPPKLFPTDEYWIYGGGGYKG